jgi:hypothetical protein
VVTAVEIGAHLAAFMRSKFSAEPGLQVLDEAFETALLERASFDVVFSATAWSWMDKDVRLGRAASLLADAGVLAIVDTMQVESDVDHGYFAASQGIYRKFGQDDQRPVPGPNDVAPPALGELQSSSLFTAPVLYRYRWDQTYTRADYQDLMRSYSNMRAMDVSDREALIAELGEFIDANYGGQVTRPLVMTLVMARKVSAGS